MLDRARDWSEQGRRPRGEWGREKKVSYFLPILRAAVPLSRSSLSITMEEGGQRLRAVTRAVTCPVVFRLTRPHDGKISGFCALHETTSVPVSTAIYLASYGRQYRFIPSVITKGLGSVLPG